MSIKADTRNFSTKYQQIFLVDAIFFEQKGPFKPKFSNIFTINEIRIFRSIVEWYMLFFTKFRSHRGKNQKVMTENLSQQNALVLITEPP